MRKTINFICAATLLTVFVSCGGGSSTNAGADATQITSSAKVAVTDFGRGDGGKAVWVVCKGHLPSSKIFVNGSECVTTYYEDKLTAALPQDLAANQDLPLKIEIVTLEANDKSYIFELGKDYKKINNGATEIAVSSSGFGGENKNAIWVNCTGHTSAAKIFAGNTELITSYYPDHLTAALPDSLQGKSIEVEIKDASTQLQSIPFMIN